MRRRRGLGCAVWAWETAERRVGEQVTCERRYYVTSLAGDAQAFGNAVRSHWSIGAIRFAETSESSGMASKEGKRSLTTDQVTWGAIPHPLGERGNAAPSR